MGHRCRAVGQAWTSGSYSLTHEAPTVLVARLCCGRSHPWAPQVRGLPLLGSCSSWGVSAAGFGFLTLLFSLSSPSWCKESSWGSSVPLGHGRSTREALSWALSFSLLLCGAGKPRGCRSGRAQPGRAGAWCTSPVLFWVCFRCLEKEHGQGLGA